MKVGYRDFYGFHARAGAAFEQRQLARLSAAIEQCDHAPSAEEVERAERHLLSNHSSPANQETATPDLFAGAA